VSRRRVATIGMGVSKGNEWRGKGWEPAGRVSKEVYSEGRGGRCSKRGGRGEKLGSVGQTLKGPKRRMDRD